jgi:hypothetical protein
MKEGPVALLASDDHDTPSLATRILRLYKPYFSSRLLHLDTAYNNDYYTSSLLIR